MIRCAYERNGTLIALGSNERHRWKSLLCGLMRSSEPNVYVCTCVVAWAHIIGAACAVCYVRMYALMNIFTMGYFILFRYGIWISANGAVREQKSTFGELMLPLQFSLMCCVKSQSERFQSSNNILLPIVHASYTHWFSMNKSFLHCTFCFEALFYPCLTYLQQAFKY